MVVQNVKYTLEFSLLLGHFHLRAQKWELTYSMRTIFYNFQHSFVTSYTGLQTVLWPIFSAGASKFCERSHWRNHHIAPSHKRCYFCCIWETTNSKRYKASETALLIWAVQRGLFISSDQHSANKLLRAQNRFTQEAVLISCYCTVLYRSSEKHLNSLQNE